MFSREHALKPTAEADPSVESLAQGTFSNFLHNHECCAGFLCRWNELDQSADLICAVGIPAAPFKISKRAELTSFVAEGLKSYAAPHVHSITDKLFREIGALTSTDGWHHRGFFIPGYFRENAMILIGFAKQPRTMKLCDDMLADAAEVISVASFLLSASSMKNRLAVMENFVREIGHDLASSVQAVIPKLSNIRRGLIPTAAIPAKLAEAEAEILSAYQTADALGITVDPAYNVGVGDIFELGAVIDYVITLCRAEAAERHIEIQVQVPGSELNAWGDSRGVQIALTHLVLNAIKYGKGASKILITAAETIQDVQLYVQNVGKPLDAEESLRMWDFGWRGQSAREMHVNGSGIGLYTVKKIILAHGGSVGVKPGPRSEVVTLFFSLPKKESHMHRLLR